jgi:hypothetical protein
LVADFGRQDRQLERLGDIQPAELTRGKLRLKKVAPVECALEPSVC